MRNEESRYALWIDKDEDHLTRNLIATDIGYTMTEFWLKLEELLKKLSLYNSVNEEVICVVNPFREA